MRIHSLEIKVLYLPLYVAIPLVVALVVISGYLVWWLIHGTWPAIFFLMASLMGIVEVWEKTKVKKDSIFLFRKVDPL